MGGIMKQNAIVEKMLEVVIKNQATEIALLKEQILLLKQQNLRLAQMQEIQLAQWTRHNDRGAAADLTKDHRNQMLNFVENESKVNKQISEEVQKAQQEAHDLRCAETLEH